MFIAALFTITRTWNLEKEMATHSSTLAWKIPWMEEPGRLQSMGTGRAGQDWVSSLSISLSCIGEGNGNPLQYSCLENPRDGGTWWAAVYGVAQSRTRLKRLSSTYTLTESLHISYCFVYCYKLSFFIHLPASYIHTHRSPDRSLHISYCFVHCYKLGLFYSIYFTF